MASDPLVADLLHLKAMEAAERRIRELCPGLAPSGEAMAAHLRANREAHPGSTTERTVEELALWLLGAAGPLSDAARAMLRDFEAGTLKAPRGYAPLAPIPIWLRLEQAPGGRGAMEAAEPGEGPQGAAVASRKRAERKSESEAA